ncbi:MAG: DNA repair protein RecO [Candidatus Marinimicrobia bacterium]|nr:DNA repair protein RecO [Candidatus Neomarinimicrobiota bacterium]
MQNTTAIVLKMKAQGESSSLIHVYSREFGKLILIAKGARGPKSDFRGLLEPFSLLNIHYNEKKGRAYHFLSHAEYLDPFTHLKTNPRAVLYGSVLLEILYKIPDTQTDPALFDLLRDVLTAVNRGSDAVNMHAFFILHYLRLEGLMLDPEHCFQCGKVPDKACFLPHSGQILCENCSQGYAPVWELPATLLSLLIMMMNENIARIAQLRETTADVTLLNRLLWNTLASRFENCRTLRSVDILRKVL